MKKILLFVAAALFAIGGTAQNVRLAKSLAITPPTSEKSLNIVGGLNRVNTLKAGQRLQKSVSRVPQAKVAPAGEAHDYFFYRIENVYSIGDLGRINKVTLYFDGNTVYIPNDFYLSQFNETEPAYVTGTVSADGSTITIPSHQEIGTVSSYYGDMVMYLSKGDIVSTAEGETLNESSDPIVLNVDPNGGIIYDNSTDDNPAFVGIFTDSGFYGYAYNMMILPSSMFTASKRTLTGTGEVADFDIMQYVAVDVNKTVDEYYCPDLSLHAILGLFDCYPGSYVMAFDNEDGSIGVGCQTVADDTALTATDNLESSQIDFSYVSTLDADATGAYTQKEGEGLRDLVSDGQSYYSYDSYSGLKLGAPTSSGISSVITNDEKDAVSTQYYDLSGRRVSGAEKGVSIKVMKFADGTSKAVKVMK